MMIHACLATTTQGDHNGVLKQLFLWDLHELAQDRPSDGIINAYYLIGSSKYTNIRIR